MLPNDEYAKDGKMGMPNMEIWKDGKDATYR